jgi:hypothetical protein
MTALLLRLVTMKHSTVAPLATLEGHVTLLVKSDTADEHERHHAANTPGSSTTYTTASVPERPSEMDRTPE